MRLTAMLIAGAAALSLAACGGDGSEGGSNTAAEANTVDAGADRTIADSLDEGSRFAAAARAAGFDKTLAGPGPYTVLAPTDEAFAKLPPGRFEELSNQENRPELTRILTYHILPGTVLAEDIGKAIDNSNGTAMLATMGGEVVTATRDGDRIVLADGSGNRASVTQADLKRSNGVVHQIDSVLVPGGNGETAPAN